MNDPLLAILLTAAGGLATYFKVRSDTALRRKIDELLKALRNHRRDA